MEKVYEKTCNIIIISVLFVLLLFSNIRLYSTQKYLRLIEQRFNDLRTELESAQDREQELTETVDNIRGITERTDQILGQSSDTIQGIREKIQTLEEYFNNIHQYMCTNDNNHDDNTDSKE